MPQQQAVAAGFDEFVTSVRSDCPWVFVWCLLHTSCTVLHTCMHLIVRSAHVVAPHQRFTLRVWCVQVVDSLKRKAQARQGGAENVISAQDIREAVDSFKKTKSLR